jgi:UrcA family protein
MNRCLAFARALRFASLTVSSPCFAGPVDGDAFLVRHLLVRYADLDLSTATGIKALDRRVEHALNLVCVDYSGPSAAGTIDPVCKSDGRRSVQPQVAVAIARQKLASGENPNARSVEPVTN